MRKIRNTIRKKIELYPEPHFWERIVIASSRRAIRKGRGSAPEGNRRLFIDLSVLAANDAGTGIQRVVRGIALQADLFSAAGWDVQFVTATRKRKYHRIDWPHKSDKPDRTPIQGGAGDVFLGLDYALDTVRFQEAQLRQLAANGVRMMFLIHDLLPIDRPEWFPPLTANRFRKWLRVLASISDTILCNSGQTERDLQRSLAQHFNLATPMHTLVIPMGHDVAGSMHSQGLPDGFEAWLETLGKPAFLTVSTIEPRKGHADLIAAFTALWNAGHDYRLVLVGRAGWQVEDLLAQITTHPEFNKRLFWHNGISDEALIKLYQQSTGIIIPSLAEGYGLPLIEALHYKKPVLARDISVFRDHQDLGVEYFAQHGTAEVIAADVVAWAKRIEAGDINVSSPADQTWKDSADYLVRAL